MYKKNNLILFLLGCLVVAPAFSGQTVAKNNRSFTKKEGFKAYWGRSLEIDPCSSRNVAENVRFFFQCVKSKLPGYVISGPGGVLQWDKSKVFAMSNGAIQTGSVPINAFNQSVYSQWSSLYKEYTALEQEEQNLIKKMESGDLDTAEEDEDPAQGAAILDKFEQDQSNLAARIASVKTRWDSFVATLPQQYEPSALYPIWPDPLSPIFLTQTTKSGVWLVSEQFYADFRKLLDDNPNAHLQLMKYYLLEHPARFRKLTRNQNNFVAPDKSFKISLLCADPASVEGLILTIAVGSSPALLDIPVRACQFSAQRIAISDNSALGATGTPSAGTNFSF